MKKGFLALAVSSLVGFSAQASMQDYAGSYAGKFDGKKGSLIVSVNGGTMSASFMGANGSTDILGGKCGSTIGQMTDIDMDGTEVDSVTFAFNPGSCGHKVEGRDLFIDFGHDNGKVESARASIFVRTDMHGGGYQCFPNPNPPGGATCWPTTQSHDWYATGKFKK